MQLNLIYITFSNKEEAQKIAKTLLQERLVACVNIFPVVHSMYWGKNKIHSDDEVVMIAKTKESLVDQVIAKVKSLHSYDCPCVVAFPLTHGNPDFLKWIEKVTK